ncbi:metallo-beta-lactamase superfamily protein [Fonsecaea pedrosoi]|nr:metallo-beta-lactamase superfamily protein [Fonsecaea pedrosoi]
MSTPTVMEESQNTSRTLSLDLPGGSDICHVSIINTTCDITVPPHYLVEPKIPGYEWINLPTFSYYIKHERLGTELLFDLGARADWQNHVPHISGLIQGHVQGVKIEQDVQDILANGNVDICNIDTFVLSHWHFDHCGAPSKLPKSVKMVVGPGFREAFMPGYPTRQDSPFHEADFEDREVVELSFSDSLQIGQFKAHDFFGDGSFYILDVPGHAVGHMAGLVRTTQDTFVLLGADTCHFAGSIRPSKYIPIPDIIPEGSALDRRLPRPCLCGGFLSSHPHGEDGRSEPFTHISTDAATFYKDPIVAEKSVLGLMEFDADPRVLVTIAHDPAALDVYEFFPRGSLNDWQQKGWKEAARWGFLSELPYNGKTVRPLLVDGLYKQGRKIRGLELPEA